MASPIEPTPMLEGEDAKNLLKQVNSVTYSKDKQQFLNECKEIYKKTKR